MVRPGRSRLLDMPSSPRVFILDANALLHRAWHALPPLTNPEGQVVNAVYGTMMVVMKLLEREKPEAMIACWDTEAATFRHEAFKEYKAQRKEQPDELYAQIPLIQEGLKLLGIPSLFLDGFEADDLIGTAAMRAKKAGWEVVIVTSDRDALQLIQPGICVMAFKKGVSETVIYDEAEVKKQYGLTPKQFLDYKVLRGDPSDNIPGVRGIGEKGATDLLQKYGDLSGIFKAAHNASSDLSPAVRQKLLASEKEIPAIISLVTVLTDVPMDWKPERRIADTVDQTGLQTFLQKMGFRSLAKRQGPIKIEKATKASTKKSSQIRIERGAEVSSLVEALDHAHEVIVHVVRGAPGSLFAQTVEGLLLGVGSDTYQLLPAALKDASALKKLQKVLDRTGLHKIAHDAKAEMKALEDLGLSIETWSFDTMLAAYVLGAGERNHDLWSIAARYAGMTVSPQTSSLEEMDLIRRAAPALRKALAEDGLESVLTRFELPLVPALRRMERHGILIDKPYLGELERDMSKEKQALEKKMMKLVGRAFNPASPSQLAEVLFVDLKLSSQGIKRGKSAYSTAASELDKLRGQHPLIELIEDHRELSKLLSTYVEVLPGLADKTGRVHTTFNQAVAATGRLSSSDPNLQNIPVRTEVGRKIRRAFVAEKGYALLSCDYSQIELRIVAALAKDQAMLEAFHRGEDIHTATAAAIWHVPLENITKDQRRIAKAINFGLIFGQGPQGLSVAAGIPFADAKKFIAAYFDVYRGIKMYMEETRALAHKLGYVETLFGRRRPLPEIHSDLHQLRAQAERMAINMPVQGTDADLMKLAMIALDRDLPSVSAASRILLQVHDELVLEVPEREVKRVATFVKDIMENVEKVGVPIVVEAKAGRNWEEMERL